MEVTLNEFTFLIDKCSTRDGCKVYHCLKLLPLIVCNVNMLTLDAVLVHPFLGRSLLAHPVYLAGYIERIGTGTTDVIEECVAAGLKEPTFEQDGDFKVTIWRKSHKDEDKMRMGDPEVIQSGPEVIQSDPVLDKLKEALKMNPQLSRSKLSKLLGISERQVRKMLYVVISDAKLHFFDDRL